MMIWLSEGFLRVLVGVLGILIRGLWFVLFRDVVVLDIGGFFCFFLFFRVFVVLRYVRFVEFGFYESVYCNVDVSLFSWKIGIILMMLLFLFMISNILVSIE